MKEGGWQHHTAGVDDLLTGCQLKARIYRLDVNMNQKGPIR
jgi:hypothetical protein